MTPLAKLLEAALFASSRPIPAAELAALDADATAAALAAALEEVREHYDVEGHGVELVELGGGWQILTRAEYTEAIERAQLAARPQRLSGAALETLAIIAYRQPIGRAEVEEIRGVQSTAVLRTLQDRELIEPVGRSEALGRPLLYGTTRRFLEHFGFRSLEDLPRPDELPVVLRAHTLEAAPAEPHVPLHAPAEPTPLSADAAAEAEALHLPIPDELKTALHAEPAVAPGQRAVADETAAEDIAAREERAGPEEEESEAATLRE